ncbi:ubiquinone/menaquinone biosynthesis C-methylase UbiE [Actinoplanes lutulentus]|uniref:Ubiquinone/menaquinone biosynthesis C-methylase UbiE n=1 Tax=Actinoplanes lutulentus TaxID=1287878 RepID=A0A327Z721_9ACTN|nr:class I SAM-dependent methyltransferase [Actinoplanes lutulentus]MBB2940302.1 ubiquinone/menaquinone biosynthesis C-methylase UbiE [Actinoplanes lutulentus]RAK28795.1 ubiquinone/menaquinone biosynthesis C-methylase UbiE [Actinoplanes lutulentus]
MTAQDRINEYWTGRAPAYDAYQQRPERLDADRAAWSEIWEKALPPAPLDVLDVGTGSGYVALTLAGLGHRVTGIDLSEGMLTEARRHGAELSSGPVFRLGDAVAPEFPDGSFDAIVGRYVAWTLRTPGEAVANWIRLLRPGGLVAMVDSTWFADGLDAAGFYDAEVQSLLPLAAAKSIDETALALANGGLEDVSVTPLTTIFELDNRYGVSPGHEVQMQFMVTGRRV